MTQVKTLPTLVYVCVFTGLRGNQDSSEPYSLLFVTILPQSFFAFVSGHLMTFPFLSAWHNLLILMLIYLRQQTYLCHEIHFYQNGSANIVIFFDLLKGDVKKLDEKTALWHFPNLSYLLQRRKAKMDPHPVVSYPQCSQEKVFQQGYTI